MTGRRRPWWPAAARTGWSRQRRGVSPGGVGGQHLRRINTFTPLGRRATVEEIAAPYAFLASPAAAYVTGSILAVDGGYTAT